MFDLPFLQPESTPVTGGFSGQIVLYSVSFKEPVVMWRGDTVYEARQPAHEEAAFRLVVKLREVFAD